MHHLKRVGLSAATGLAALVACAAPASALGDDDLDPSHQETVYHLVTQPTDQSLLDLDGLGPSQGDELIITGNLLQNGQPVGTFSEVCTLTRVTAVGESDLQCQGTLVLPQGQITFQGQFTITADGPSDVTLAIRGGTGSYSTAHGFIHAVNPGAAQTEVVVHVIP
ncbi:allene oxide cyclase barrel-like domain-containing protein [Streptomyces sp. LZ34]